jgi:hypothetical protein
LNSASFFDEEMNFLDVWEMQLDGEKQLDGEILNLLHSLWT